MYEGYHYLKQLISTVACYEWYIFQETIAYSIPPSLESIEQHCISQEQIDLWKEFGKS